jgi:VWFA-related protein
MEMEMAMKTIAAKLWRMTLPSLIATTVVAVAQGQSQSQTAKLPQGQAAPAPRTQKPTQNPTFVARTDYVSSDIRVTDKNGMFVPGLRQQDFTVLEDGVEQRITNFTVSIGGRVLPTFVGTPASTPIPGLIVPTLKPPTDTTGRIFIVFIDDMHLQPADSILARKVLEQLRDTVLKENDLVGIVSTGFSSIAQDLVYDPQHKRLNEAIKKVMGSADTPREIIDMPQTTGGVQKLRYNANVAFKTASEILSAAAQRKDRRKAFLYVSSGYSFNPFKDSRYEKAKELFSMPTGVGSDSTNGGTTDPNSSGDMPRLPGENPFEKAGSEFSEMDLISEIAYLVNEARRANVVFYTMDPRGLQAGPNISDRLGMDEWHEWVTVTESSLRILGDNTGGFCICGTNDFLTPMRRIDAEMSDYYVIGYYTNNPDPMKLNRRITIKVNRPDLKLIYSEGYTLPKTQKK